MLLVYAAASSFAQSLSLPPKPLKQLQLALQDVKDGFSGLGPLSDEKDRVTLVRLYLLGLSYAMAVVPKGDKAAGKTYDPT